MKVFVSYSRDCEAIARSVVSDFESLGHEVWFDRELSGGQAWWSQILAAIRDCGLFVFLLHPRSLDSVACTRERAYAVALGKPVLPLKIAEGVSLNLLPPDLAQCQIIAYHSGERAEVLALARAVAAVPPASPLPETLPPPPEVPASYLGALAMRIDATPQLGFEDQSALLVDLRQALRREESRADAELLLARMRRRRDLLAAIADEIDSLRREQRSVADALPTASPAGPAASEPAGAMRPAAPPEAASRLPRQWHPVWAFMGIAAVAGVLTGWAYAASRTHGTLMDVLVIAGITTGGGLLAGLASGRDRRGWALAGAGAALGAVSVLVVASGERDAYVGAVVWGLGPGAVLGGLMGRLWRRLRAH